MISLRFLPPLHHLSVRAFSRSHCCALLLFSFSPPTSAVRTASRMQLLHHMICAHDAYALNSIKWFACVWRAQPHNRSFFRDQKRNEKNQNKAVRRACSPNRKHNGEMGSHLIIRKDFVHRARFALN